MNKQIQKSLGEKNVACTNSACLEYKIGKEIACGSKADESKFDQLPRTYFVCSKLIPTRKA